MSFDARRVISGTWGQVWEDSELIAECYGLQAKVKKNKDKISRCGTMANDTKTTSTDGTGTVRLHKLYSRNEDGEATKQGIDRRVTIISALKDPDAWGYERVAVKNVSYDDIVVADWEAGKPGTVERPFTFTDYEFIDPITPR